MELLYMKNEEIITSLNHLEEEIGFLEELSTPSALIEEKLEELRTLRHELERKLHYDKSPTFKNDQENCKES